MKTKPNDSIDSVIHTVGDIQISKGGLTKREHFAGLILQGLSANPAYNNLETADSMRACGFTLEKMAVGMADGLIAQLNKDFKPWFGKLVYMDSQEGGVIREHKFETEAEAKAYTLGFYDCKEQYDIARGSDEDNLLEDHEACATQLESNKEE